MAGTKKACLEAYVHVTGNESGWEWRMHTAGGCRGYELIDRYRSYRSVGSAFDAAQRMAKRLGWRVATGYCRKRSGDMFVAFWER